LRRAYLLTLVAVAGWSVGPVCGKTLLKAEGPGGHPHPVEVAFWAIAAGWVLLLGYLVARRRLRWLGELAWRGWIVLVLMGLFGWAGYAWWLNVALARLPVPDAIVINYLHPVFTVVFQGAMFGAVVRRVSGWEEAGERRRPRAATLGVALGLCLLGVAVMATHGHPSALGRVSSAAGAMAALFAAFAWGVYSNLGRFVAVRGGRAQSVPADVQTVAAMTFGLAMLAAVLVTGGVSGTPSSWHAQLLLPGSRSVDVSAWHVVGVMGLALYCIGFTAWLAALDAGRQAGAPHRLPPLTYFAPVLGIVLARLLLQEPFGAGFWQGAALIAVGNLVIALTRASPFGFAQGRRSPRPDS